MNFDNPPKDGAFFARNMSTNKASVSLKGNITNPAYSALVINVYQNHILKSSYNFNFNYSQGITTFGQNVDLVAGKYIYTIEFKLTGSLSYDKIIDGIMVGDAYLVQGQSNAVAGNYVNLNYNYSYAYNDTFIRSFGNSYPYSGYMIGDTAWCKADGENYYSRGSVGQWPLVMAKTILDSFGIPICLINGAVGGTAIWQHVRTPSDPTDLNSIYGRLLYRVRKARLENNIRGILYFQGESDGSYAVMHDSLFREIYANWNTDYKGFKKLYVVQVRGNGCGLPSIQLREFQRDFEFSLAKCKVISSNGLNGHDGCHYAFANGYELLGKQIAALVSRDLYQCKTVNNIDPPNILNCYYSNAAQDEITVNMQNPSDIIYGDNLFYKIFRIEGDISVSVISGTIKNNKVVLKLNKSSCGITGLTYDSDIGTQPWVKNKLNMGLISCYNVPVVRQQIQSYYSGCKKALITLGEDSISGCKYLWRRLSTKQNYTTSKIKIRGDSVEAFSLIITYGVNACRLKDTLIVYLSPDLVTLPELGNDRTICKNDTLNLKPDFFGFSEFKWTSSLKNINYQTFYKIYKAEKIVLTATSQRQCIYKDSLVVKLSEPVVMLPENITICANADTLITVPNTFNTYQWNLQAGPNYFRAGAGLLYLEVSNSLGCKARDTLKINIFKTTSKPVINENICKNESKLIALPLPFKSWYYKSEQIQNGLNILPDMTYPVLLTDSNNCVVKDTIKVVGKAVPEFSLGPDTGYCRLGHLVMQLPDNMAYYSWNSLPQNNSTIDISKPGEYIATVKDYNQCQYSDSINITEFLLPDLSGFGDTVLCKDSSWKPVFDKYLFYTVNGQSVKNLVFKGAGIYEIIAESKRQCRSSVNIEIKTKECNSNALTFLQTEKIKIYPNPFNDIINISISKGDIIQAKITGTTGQLLMSFQLTEGENAIDLSELERGIYFLEIEGLHYSILKL